MTLPEAAMLTRYWTDSPPTHLLVKGMLRQMGLKLALPPAAVLHEQESRLSTPDEVKQMVSAMMIGR